MAVTKCANCGAVVNSEAEGCPECGADPRTGEGAVAGFAVVENCAGCGASVDAGTERCANCGADPRTGLTAAQAAEVNHAAAMMGWGAVLAVGGLLVTLITYARVSQGGGTYFVAYGPMIAGVILFFMGLSKSSKTKSKTVITPKAVIAPKPSSRAPAVERQSTQRQRSAQAAEQIRGPARAGRSRATRRSSTPVDARCRGPRGGVPRMNEGRDDWHHALPRDQRNVGRAVHDHYTHTSTGGTYVVRTSKAS